MIALKLARLIESHADQLAMGLVQKICTSLRTAEYHDAVPREELERSVREIYHHISDWLLTKTESDVELRFTETGMRREAEGLSFSQLMWALAMTKEHLWGFLQREALIDRPVELFGELELMTLLDQFFDRAMYYAAVGYEQAHAERGAEARLGAD
ncbi:MAG TPA: hypothetical protein VJQ50_11790 [Terriglobales bacterium]|nr:hypothetical protein [Terriglobales bacterium]